MDKNVNKVEQKIFFKSGNRQELEAAFFPGTDRAVVLAHPHPLYGGNMDNLVIGQAAAACQAKGFTTLRFNFRGAGKSSGTYDQGRGEQKDLLSAAEYVKSRGVRIIDFIGYSFGAWVIAHTPLEFPQSGRVLMISPPSAMMDFENPPPCPGLKLIITGSQDEIAPPAMVEKLISRLNPDAELKIIAGADHFFSAGLEELKNEVYKFLEMPDTDTTFSQ
jgi:alpha/beta superfamily hydrolase